MRTEGETVSTLTDVTKEALSLPVEDRVVLAQFVWESMEHFANPDVENAWLVEADRRWREIDEGKVQCVPATEVMQRARKSLAT
jgi:putative addiction module component (TIGR02574 family)